MEPRYFTFYYWLKCNVTQFIHIRDLESLDINNKDYLGAEDLCYGGKTIDTYWFHEDELIKIRKYQRDTYNKIVEMQLEGSKNFFLKDQYAKCVYKDDALNAEISMMEDGLNEEQGEYQYLIRGGKRFGAILGDDYQLVEEQYSKFKKGELTYCLDFKYPFPELNFIKLDVRLQYLKWLKEFKRYGKNKLDKTLKPEKFETLFIDSKYAPIVKNLLERDEYTKDGKWIDNKKKNKIATAFFVLKDSSNKICIVVPTGDDTPQIKIWCIEFGINPSINEIRNLLKRPKYEKEKKPDYLEFTELFESLKQTR